MVNTAGFTKRLQKILDYYGLSATAFSEKIDFNRSTISHLLSGRNKPSLEFVLKVLQTFPEVELHWLLNGKGVFPKSKNIEDSTTQVSIRKEDSTLFDRKNENLVTTHSHKALDYNKTVDRIVIFFKDGTFKEYKN